MIDYDKFKNIQKPVPTVTDLDPGIYRKKTKGEGKTMSIFVALLGIFAILLFTQYRNILSLLPGLSPLAIISIYLVITILLSAKIAVMFNVDLSEKMRNKTLNQGGNDKFSLNKVWRIAVGGLTESTPIKTPTYKGNTMSVKFDNDAIILKILMDSVIDTDENGDINHYLSVTNIYDIIVKNKYEFEIISMRYNPDNDDFWDSSSKKISKANNLGNDYTFLRTKLENRLYQFTKEYSTVDAQYLIIKSTASSVMTPVQLINTIIANLKMSRLKIYGINLQEFKQFLEQYFNINISLEDITEFVSTTSNLPFETKLLGYTLEGKYNEINKPFVYTLPNVFISYEEELMQNFNANKQKHKITKVSNIEEELREDTSNINTWIFK